MTHDDFFTYINRMVPDIDCDERTRLDQLPVYQRITVTRWLSDLLERPTAVEVLEQLETLGDAWGWLRAALDNGERLRDRGEAVPAASSRVRLRPIMDHDIVPLYEAAFDPRTAGRWRYRGRTMPFERFVSTLFDGTVVQLMVELQETGTAVGMVTAYEDNPQGLHCKIAFLRCGPRQRGDGGAVFEGMSLFISHLFATFPYRKLFAEVPDYNMDLFAPGFFVREGVLQEFLFHNGSFADLHIVSVTRERWEELAALTGW